MPVNRSVVSYFSQAPTPAQARAFAAQKREEASAVRRITRSSSLEPHISTIFMFLSETDASLPVICKAIRRMHGLKIDKSTLCRFIQKHQELTDLRPKPRSEKKGQVSLP